MIGQQQPPAMPGVVGDGRLSNVRFNDVRLLGRTTMQKIRFTFPVCYIDPEVDGFTDLTAREGTYAEGETVQAAVDKAFERYPNVVLDVQTHPDPSRWHLHRSIRPCAYWYAGSATRYASANADLLDDSNT